MKKYITALIAAALSALLFTACDENGESSDLSSEYSNDEESSSAPDIFNENNSVSSSEIEPPTEHTVYVYGETEIPNIPCGYADWEGKAAVNSDNPALKKTLESALDSMVFETASCGDYTAKLVGDTVRTDTDNFPTSVFVQNLRVEVEKDGKKLEGAGRYGELLTYLSQYRTEYILYTDRIGNYIDFYSLEAPTIAMRYFFSNDGREVTKAVDFATVQNDAVLCGFGGKNSEGVGVMLDPKCDTNDYKKILTVCGAEDNLCRASIFAADEFAVIDGTTLFDDELNISYIFKFSDPPAFELYSTEVSE